MFQPNIISGPSPKMMQSTNLCVGELIFNQLQLHGRKVSQVQWDTGEELTFIEVFEKSRLLAVFLKQEGVTIGDRIAICSENNLNFGIPLCAGLFIGATICPLNPIYSPVELQHTLAITEPKFIFVSPLVIKNVQRTINNLSWSPRLILLSESSEINLPSISQVIADVPISRANKFKPVKVTDGDHVVCIMCSSGTTGLPKGVELTTTNIMSTMNITIDPTIGLSGSEMPSLGLLPLFHAYAFNLFLVWYVTGIKVIILSRFEEKSFLKAIEKNKIEILHLAPPLMVFLAKNPLVLQYDLSSVRTIWCGAAALSVHLEKAVKERLKVKNIQQGYGLTECTLTVLLNPIGATKNGSVGVLVPGASGKVVPISDDGTGFGPPLGPNLNGELCFKSDMIMKGYYGNINATKSTIDSEGWLHTGDVGYYDEDGYFYIVDRLKELIKYKGFQVPPVELEAILLSHPEIKDAAVIGLPDEDAGELPTAFVVKQDGSKLEEHHIVKFVNDQVSPQKRIRGGVNFVSEIPKSSSGKILRRVMRQMLASKI